MIKIPEKAKVKFKHPIPMSDGEKRILEGEIVEVYLAPKGRTSGRAGFKVGSSR
jgi:hypothetical protein